MLNALGFHRHRHKNNLQISRMITFQMRNNLLELLFMEGTSRHHIPNTLQNTLKLLLREHLLRREESLHTSNTTQRPSGALSILLRSSLHSLRDLRKRIKRDNTRLDIKHRRSNRMILHIRPDSSVGNLTLDTSSL